MRIEWMMAVAIAIGVVGVIQWLKGVWKTAPAVLWAVVSPVACFLLALFFWFTGNLDFAEMMVLGILAVAIAQLAYEVIVQGVPGLVAAVMKMIERTIAGSADGSTTTFTATTTTTPPTPKPPETTP